MTLVSLLLMTAATATTHNDCRISLRDCMKKKEPLEACLKIKRTCEAEVRAGLEKNKKAAPPAVPAKEQPKAAEAESAPAPESH